MLFFSFYILLIFVILWLLFLFFYREILWADFILFLALIFVFQLTGWGFYFFISFSILLAQVFLTLIVYKPELKVFFRNFFGKQTNFFLISNSIRDFLDFAVKKDLNGILVFKKKNDLSAFIRTGERVNLKIDSLILSQIFSPQSHWNKGAAIIEGNRIVALNCVLPKALPRYLSSAERSGLALSRIVDALILVFERGKISLFLEGERINVTPQRIGAILKTLNLRNKIKFTG